MSTPQIKFGINATNQFTNWAEYRHLCLEAEAMGFDSFWVFDHFVAAPRTTKGPVLECLTTTSALAAITKRIPLGTLVLGVTYRNPALVAKMGSMVDVISNGRFTLGMGGAGYEVEHRMYGIPFPSGGQRVRMLDEALEIVKRMWTDQPASFSGDYFTIEEALLEPLPVQQPRPPILVGGWGDKMMRVVAKHADIVNSSGTPSVLKTRFDKVDAACAEFGRDPASIERATSILHSFSATPAREEEKQKFLEWLWNQPFDAMEERTLTGSPEEVVEKLRGFIDIGITHFMMSVMAPYDLEGMKIMVDKVIPEFR